jgi:hypothetical protein
MRRKRRSSRARPRFRVYAPEPNTVAKVQLKCPETGRPIDIFDYMSPGFVVPE